MEDTFYDTIRYDMLIMRSKAETNGDLILVDLDQTHCVPPATKQEAQQMLRQRDMRAAEFRRRQNFTSFHTKLVFLSRIRDHRIL